jgi:hypothetical protein
MRQAALTILAPIRAEPRDIEKKEAAVRKLGKDLDACRDESRQGALESPTHASAVDLDAQAWERDSEEIGTAPRHSDICRVTGAVPNVTSELRRLLATETIHYMSFFVVPDGEGRAYVALEVNADGNLRKLRHRLATCAPAFLRALFEGCEELNPSCDEQALEDFMARNAQRPNVFFVAFPGRGVDQIRREQELRIAARDSFEQTVCDWSRLSRQPVDPSSPREAPSSASAIWECIRDELKDKPLVRDGATRPASVRWSLSMGGWRDQVNLWGNRLFAALLVANAGGWFLATARAHQLAPYVVAASAFGFAAIMVLAAWWREAPRALSPQGRRLVVRTALWSWLVSGAVLASALGASALVTRFALHLPRFESNYQAVAAMVAFFGAAATLKRIGVRTSVSAALLLLLVDIGLQIPAEGLPRMFSVIVALIGILPLLAATAFFYVMDGLAGSIVAAAALGAGWLALVARYRDAPIELAVIGYVATIVFFIAAVARVASWLSAVRRVEESENAPIAQQSAANRDLRHLDSVVEREDRTLQNHLVVLSRLKDDPLRIRTLRRVLRAVSLVVKVFANRGDLAGIRTIHFAQFIILEKLTPKRLLFLSNYDSAFGSYLQEFNRVSGVTAVWSNCVGFPPAFGLVGGGAQDEQGFKQFGRNDQIPTLGWYSAYPNLFIGDIETATATREKLRRRLNDPSTWKGRMRARFDRPLSEADCDAALQEL